MSLQENQVHFFERFYSELAFAPALPTTEEIINSINSSRSTHLIYTNLSSGEILEGPFYIENNLLVYYQVILHWDFILSQIIQADKPEPPRILLDILYARIHAVFRCNEKIAAATPKIYLYKDQNTYEIAFDHQNAYEDWMLNLRKFCVLTNFEKKYQITEVNDKKGDFDVRKEFWWFFS